MSPPKCQVFLNFRGPDTRTDFTRILYDNLKAAGVRVFKDDDELPLGRRIGAELLRAIRSCKIAIPIISTQYAESSHCLDELVEIMDCYRNFDMLVFPVFYGVGVFDVRYQGGNFNSAFEKHNTRHSPEEVRKWREALRSLTRIRGWITTTTLRSEQLIKLVVAKISSELQLQVSWIERLGMSQRRESECQVFLSFRGRDTGSGFARLLFDRLKTKRIRVFDNDDPLLIGKDFPYEINKAIGECKICIPILSWHYASSRWCLDELAEMMEKNAIARKPIMPIFYGVRPADVRHLLPPFGEFMARNKGFYPSHYCERWEKALREVGNFRGWQVTSSREEKDLVTGVVKEVSKSLKNS